MFDGFWDNVSRYPRFLVTIILGIYTNTFGWLTPLLKNPVTAIALVGLLVGLMVFLSLTLRAMLGLGAI